MPNTEATVQELLAERRANVKEASAERCPIARQMLEFHIAEIDRELATRRGGK